MSCLLCSFRIETHSGITIRQGNDNSDVASSITDEADLDLREWEWIRKEEDEEVYQRLTKLTRSLSICVGRGNNRNAYNFYRNAKDKNSARESEAIHHNNNYQLDVKSLEFENVILKNKESEPDIPLFDCVFVAGLYHDNTINRQVPFTKDVFPEDVRKIVYNLNLHPYRYM